MNNKILIENDVHDIACRLKGLDENYKIYFNVGTSKFEIHNMKFRPTLQVVSPYKQLDIRTYLYVCKTQVKNLDKILDEINQSNLRLEKENQYRIVQKAAESFEKIVAN